MINVSQAFVDESKKEFNNINFKFYNNTRSRILNDIYNFSVSLSDKSRNNKTTTDVMSFDYLDNEINIFKGDELSCISFLNLEEIIVYTGKVERINEEFRGNKKISKVKVVDITKELISAEFNEDVSFYDIYLCNNLDKNNSLLHQLGYLANLNDSQMLFDDIKVNDNYVMLKVFLAKKGESIVSYLTKISTEYVANTFANNNNQQIFRTEYSTPVVVYDYEFNEKNTMIPLNKDEVISAFNTIELSYKEYITDETESLVFQTPEGDLLVLANSSSNIIEVPYSYEVVSSPNVQNLEVKNSQGELQDTGITNFVLNADKAVLTVNNTNDFDVYISFDIYAKAIKQIQKRTIYNENPATEKFKSVNASYIQNEETADEVAKWLYYYYCKDRNSYSFKTTMPSFLEINDVVNLKVDSQGIDELIVIKNISYSKDQLFKMNVKAESYIEPEFQNLLLTKIESLKKEDADLTSLQNDILQNAEDISNAESAIEDNTNLIKISDDEVIFRILSGQIPQYASLASQFKLNGEGFELAVEDIGGGDYQPVKRRTILAISVDGIDAEVFEVDGEGVKTSRIQINADNINLTVSQVNTNTSQISIQGTQISANSSEIVLRATQADLNTTNNRVTSAESAIVVNSNNINLKVSKNNVISEINLSTEGIRINGDNITLDGNTVVNGDFEVNGDVIINGSLNASQKIINSTITNEKIVDMVSTKLSFPESGIVLDDYYITGTNTKGLSIISDISGSSSNRYFITHNSYINDHYASVQIRAENTPGDGGAISEIRISNSAGSNGEIYTETGIFNGRVVPKRATEIINLKIGNIDQDDLIENGCIYSNGINLYFRSNGSWVQIV